jgi:hypothetical protein
MRPVQEAEAEVTPGTAKLYLSAFLAVVLQF